MLVAHMNLRRYVSWQSVPRVSYAPVREVMVRQSTNFLRRILIGLIINLVAMKYIKFLLITVVLMAAASCDRDELSDSEPQGKNMVEISFDASLDVQTKVEVGEKGENGYKVLWSPEDRLNVFPYDYADKGNMAGGYMFSTDIEQPSLNASFSGKIYESDEYFAVYPYDSQHEWYPQEKKIRAVISREQYDKGLNSHALMVAKEEDGKLTFKHVGGYVKLGIPESVTDLVSIKFETPEIISADYVEIYPESMTIGNIADVYGSDGYGSVQLTPYDAECFEPGTKYLSVLPAVMDTGFSLVFFNSDGLRIIKRTSNMAEIVQGQILNLGEISDLCFDYPVSTCEEVYNAVMEGNGDKYYRVTGTITSVTNTKYGNWYISDETGYQIYIYGTIDGSGEYYGSEKFDLAVGDSVTVQGPVMNYNGMVEFVDANIVELNKCPVRVDHAMRNGVVLPAAGGDAAVALTVKGDRLDVNIPEDAQSWLSLVDVEWLSDTRATVIFRVLENFGTGRKTSVEFNTVKGGKDYFTALVLEQESVVLEATAAEIAEAKDVMQIYRLTGYVNSVQYAKRGNLYLKDYSGEVYINGTYDTEKGAPLSEPIDEGDIITVEGCVSSPYLSRMSNVKLVDRKHVNKVSVSEFLEATVDDTAYYRLTGRIDNIKKMPNGDTDPCGNFDLIDESGSVYVSGLLTGWGGPSHDFLSLGLREGDLVTIVGQRSQYDGTPCVDGAFYVMLGAQAKSSF